MSTQVGENIILHVRTNFYLDKFRYILLSKGCVVKAGQHSMEVGRERELKVGGM